MGERMVFLTNYTEAIGQPYEKKNVFDSYSIFLKLSRWIAHLNVKGKTVSLPRGKHRRTSWNWQKKKKSSGIKNTIFGKKDK